MTRASSSGLAGAEPSLLLGVERRGCEPWLGESFIQARACGQLFLPSREAAERQAVVRLGAGLSAAESAGTLAGLVRGRTSVQRLGHGSRRASLFSTVWTSSWSSRPCIHVGDYIRAHTCREQKGDPALLGLPCGVAGAPGPEFPWEGS